jgi:hypothetical protein
MVTGMRHRLLHLVHILAALSIAAPARAQSAAEDRAAADALYEEAGNLMKAKRWGEACPKLEASLKLDPGIGTSLRLGYCYEQVGRTASAWSAYNDAEALARKAGDKRAEEAGKHAKRIEPLLSRMVLDVAPDNRGGGVEIRRDGRVIDPAAWASAIPIDPGAHTIEASGAGRQAWKTTIAVEAKPGTQTVAVPALAAAPEVAAAVAPPTWSKQRIAGVATLGAGGVGLLTGAILGGLAIAKNNASKADCLAKDPHLCSPAGADERRAAGRMADGSTAAFIVGGVTGAAGAAVFFTAPRGAEARPASAWRFEAAPAVAAGSAGVVFRGEW